MTRKTTKQSTKRKKRTPASAKTAVTKPTLNPLRTGMPALDSITGVDEFRKGNQVYRIIHTKEIDEYENQPQEAKHKKPRGAGEGQ